MLPEDCSLALSVYVARTYVPVDVESCIRQILPVGLSAAACTIPRSNVQLFTLLQLQSKL